ncbi:unnamed protein product [Taenia asiatica]|uniref:Uncharacterized protein n=1 Tax=Taenia asiatica TaxID=60517 RepID=A0A3P6S029_TAEAS|nr:unnamed protein product [Taenia asiatica]
MWTRVSVCMLELNSQLVFVDSAVIVSDDAHAMLFDKLLHRPPGYRCSRLVDHWTPRPFFATATDAVSLARISFYASKAYHCILVLRVLSAFLYFLLSNRQTQSVGERRELVPGRWRCVAAGDVRGSEVVDFTSSLEDRANVASGTQGRAFSAVLDMIDLVPTPTVVTI